jgi:hypothetical protein
MGACETTDGSDSHGICARHTVLFIAEMEGIMLTDEQINQLTDLYNEYRDQGMSGDEAAEQVDLHMREMLAEKRAQRQAATVAA